MKTTYRYESTQRPVSIGTHPKKGVVEICNYKEGKRKVLCAGWNVVESWGYIEYNRKLTDKEMTDYELAYYGEIIDPKA